ncbi:MAG TPA: antibiotic biosynthesis monooxygenase family protein [Ktedonobacterales bacterium]|nr:antibiotic biosynthesis monooxygenase family protein [Ktedonobacterales bacterium]
MYGTVARMRVRPGAHDQLLQQLRDFEAIHVPGFVATYVYQTDADPNDYYMAVLFETKAAYDANAESAEQNARYQQMRALLESDPEWHDGVVVSGGAGAG